MDTATDSADPTRRLHARLQGLLAQFRRQLVTGWDLDSLSRLTEETARLQNRSAGLQPRAAYEAMAATHAALRARQGAHARGQRLIGQRVEDPGAAAVFWTSGIDYLQGNLVQQAGDEMAFNFQTEAM